MNNPATYISVIGPWRSGTSAVTGLLRGFGAFVGRRFYDAKTGYCTYEDSLLRKACLAAFDERPKEWGPRGDFEHRVALLRSWIVTASADAKRLNANVIAAKHPIMCMLVDELVAAMKQRHLPEAPAMQFISIEREQQEIVKSWTRKRSDQSHWWPRDDIERVIGEMDEARSASLAKVPHFKINFSDLKSSAASVAEQMAVHFNFSLDKVPMALKHFRTQ